MPEKITSVPDNVSAHPDLHLKFRYQENRASAVPGGGPDYDWTGDPNDNIDGHYYDHRRFLGHVLDYGQCPTVSNAKCMASWQLDDRRRFHGISELVFCTVALAIGKFRMGLGIDSLRTLAFLVIVFGNQATMYTNRTRQHLWSTRPSSWLVLSSVVDLLIAAMIANRGIAMAPLPLFVVGGTLVGALVFAFMVDIVKVPVFNRL
jgi:hypothetical protein